MDYKKEQRKSKARLRQWRRGNMLGAVKVTRKSEIMGKVKKLKCEVKNCMETFTDHYGFGYAYDVTGAIRCIFSLD